MTVPTAVLSTIPAAKKALQAMEREIDSVRSYEQIKKLIGAAEALRIMFRDVREIKEQAEWVIIIGRQNIGNKIADIPKATGGDQRSKLPKRVNSKNGRSDTGIPGTSRSRLIKLAQIERKPLRKICESLWAADGDATLRAVLGEGFFGDFKKARADRERALAEKIRALPDKKYGVILADPEWRFETYSEKGKALTSAEKHYPTSELDAIKARMPPASKDCVLFLWGTVPMLPQALEVMAAWGFKYVSNIVWDKEKTGTGYWFINQHEHLLVGTRGKVVPPAMGTQWPSIIRERATRHSAKPEKSYQLIEQYFPNLPRIELNARKKRDGWDSWGNEDDRP